MVQGSSTLASTSLAKTLQLSMAIVVEENNYTNTLYLDTNTTKHLTPQRNWFSTYKPLNPSLSIFMGDNGSQEAISVGAIPIHLHIGHIIEIPNVLYVPHLAKNIMFVYKAT